MSEAYINIINLCFQIFYSFFYTHEGKKWKKNNKKNKKQKKQQVFRNKSLSLGLSMIELNKKVFYEFWYDYIKPKYGEKAKLCGIDTDSFIVYVKIAEIY